MNIAIKITIFRLFLVPVFLALLLVYRKTEPGSAELLRYLALGVFIVAALSDVVDGYVARTCGMTTALGGFLDPLADKLLFGLGIIVLSLPPLKEGFPFARRPSLWYPTAVVATNVVLALGALASRILHKKVEIKADILGKVAAVLQAMTMGWIILQIPGLVFLYYPAGILTVASGTAYVVGAVQQVRAAEVPEQ